MIQQKITYIITLLFYICHAFLVSKARYDKIKVFIITMLTNLIIWFVVFSISDQELDLVPREPSEM